MKTSVLCYVICIFLLIVSITVAGCISNENSPAAPPSSTPTIQPTSTSAPIPTNTLVANSTPFITIDPIGNHAIGDVFFINGTTDLPVSENLTVQIIESFHLGTKADLGAYVHGITEDIPISPITISNTGVHQWSFNVTDPVMIALVSDRYDVGVYSKDANISSDLDHFYLYPAVVVNSTPYIAIYPIGNHSIGDEIFINGTTNLPASDSQSLQLIVYTPFITASKDGGWYKKNLTILPGSNGINLFSVDITESIGVSGDYSVELSSITDPTINQFLDFNILPEGSTANANTNPTQSPSAGNITTGSNPPYLTINHIGNKTLFGPFIISGTTNLPVSENQSLILRLGPMFFQPGNEPIWSGYDKYLEILPGSNGINQWSDNVTESEVDANNSYEGPMGSMLFFSGQYSASIQSMDTNVGASQIFTFLP